MLLQSDIRLWPLDILYLYRSTTCTSSVPSSTQLFVLLIIALHPSLQHQICVLGHITTDHADKALCPCAACVGPFNHAVLHPIETGSSNRVPAEMYSQPSTTESAYSTACLIGVYACTDQFSGQT
jgi:hypothetical protein